jgi:hypothetical protein
MIAGLLQATSLPFIVTASQIGQQIGVITKPTAAGLIAAGLLSVVIFPALGLALLRREDGVTAEGMPTPANPTLSSEDHAFCRAAARQAAAS